MAARSSRSSRRKIKNYDENNILDAFDIDTDFAGKKRRKFDEAEQTKLEELTASAVGFEADELTKEEIAAGIGSSLDEQKQKVYLEVRNHIITRWRNNVHCFLTRETVMESIKNEHKNIVDMAYDFLFRHGYINFGVAPGIRASIHMEPPKANVIIIGAGMAGLAAANQLISFGFKVIVLEGKNRPGGRVYTEKLGGLNPVAAAELGGSVITGIHANPLAVLSRQLDIPLHKIRDKCPLYKIDGTCVDLELDKKMQKEFDKLLDKATELRDLMGQSAANKISLGSTLDLLRMVFGVAKSEEEFQLLNWHFGNLEYANGSLLSQSSLAFWDQDDPHEMSGDHCFLAGGNCRLIHALSENVPIFYERIVNEIKYGSCNGVQVRADGQHFQADMALCTVSLGVLKSNSIKFVPDLPERKKGAIKRLGFGLLNKVAMLFPYVFWEKDIDYFGSLNKESRQRGEFVLFYNYATVLGGPVLVALVAGEAAVSFEKMQPADIVYRVLNVLKRIYGKKGIMIPDPVESQCTRWGSDPLSLGSYSYVAVGSSGDDHDMLAESVGDGRLFFAGEATIRQYPSTMHGAYLSGLREAEKILKATENRLSNVDPRVSKDNAVLLDDLFSKPDLQFGQFSVIFDPKAYNPTSYVLLRVLVESSKSKASIDGASLICSSRKYALRRGQPQEIEQLKLYAVLQHQQVLELMRLEGDHASRISYMIEKFGVKLVGRRGLGKLGDSLIQEIKSARCGRIKACI